MAEASPSFVRRVYLRGAGDTGDYVRATFHPSESVLVFSQWKDGTCVAATPIRVSDTTELAVLLTESLGYVLTQSSASAAAVPAEATAREPWWRSWRAWRRQLRTRGQAEPVPPGGRGESVVPLRRADRPRPAQPFG